MPTPADEAKQQDGQEHKYLFWGATEVLYRMGGKKKGTFGICGNRIFLGLAKMSRKLSEE